MSGDVIKAVILSIVEGLTEFIPVSSTGHLILVGKALEFTSANAATFEIAIQLGAILAVVVLYWKFFWNLLFHPSQWLKPSMRKLVVAALPVMIVGFLCYKAIKAHFFAPLPVAVALIVGAVGMIIVQKWVKPTGKKTQTIEEMTYAQALKVGIAQCFSLWPGMSRSGATIVGGLLAGLSYECSAQFSFIVAVPVMAIAVGYDLLKSAGQLHSHDIYLIGIGFVISFVIAILAIKTFLKILTKFKLVPFAIYRIVLAILTLIIYFVN